MPNSVINLGYCAFYHCNKLKNVTLGSGLKSIGASGDGYGVFEECDELEGIAIPASVTLLGRNAFYDCDMLKFVAIGSGVTSITEQAFYHCNELMSVAIYGNVTRIGQKAFKNCNKLESVSFLGDTPPSSFGYDCFYDCSPNLKYHVLEENYVRYNGNSYLSGKVVAGPPYNEIWYSTNDGRTAGYTNNGNPPALNAYMGCHGVQFFNGNPPEFNSEYSCFHNCHNLVSVVLPSSLTYIGHLAFAYCSSLVSVSIPNTVTGIGEYAFINCYSLVSVSIPSTVTSIGEFAFYQCYSLVSVSVPSSVTSIGNNAFHECTSLQNILLSDGLNYIGEFTFYNCSALTSVTIGNSVAGIGKSAFERCSALTSVTIGNSVANIGESAFAHCSALTSVTMGNSVASIGKLAFDGCIGLQSVTFKSVPLIDQYAFYFCNNLSSKILDLTDSDKPHIGTSLANYPGFTEARYHGTLEPGQWGTIVLPFVPTSHSGIVFFSIDNVDAANGTLTLSVAENIEAGKPYLFRNQTGDAGFTLSAAPVAPATSVPVNITASEQTAGNFALKGTFQAKKLTETGLYEQQGNEFVHAGSLSIDPFHAYLKNNGGSAATSIVINCDGVLVEITNQDDSTVTLYGLKKVEFLKENNVPSVRVTYADNSTATYVNPKKVDFEK